MQYILLIIGKVLLQERLLSSNGRSVVLAKGGVTTVQQILNRNECSDSLTVVSVQGM